MDRNFQRTPDEIKAFIDATRGTHEIDVIVLDLGSGFSPLIETGLQCADEIFIVADSSSDLKLATLFDKETYVFQDYLDITNLIYNKSTDKQQKDGYGCKSVTYVPYKQGIDHVAVVSSVNEYVRGLITPSWKK